MDLKTRSAELSSINNKAEELRVFLRELYLSWPLETNVFHVVGGDARIILNFFLKTAIELHVCET